MKPSWHIPGVRPRRFWKTNWFRELFHGVPPILAAGVIALKGWMDSEIPQWVAWISAAGAGWLLLGLCLKVLAAAETDSKDEPDVRHEGLYAAMATLTAMLTRYCEARGCGSDIRGTFHRVVPPLSDPERIEQVISYVGSSGGGEGRESAIGAGITGRAIRRRMPQVMSSTAGTEKEHRAELIADWGYTEAKAAALTPGRYSAMAIPILDKNGRQTLGVVYLDAGDRAVFELEDVQQIIGVGCEAISEFVTKRYWK